jgi:hypothetical protein
MPLDPMRVSSVASLSGPVPNSAARARLVEQRALEERHQQTREQHFFVRLQLREYREQFDAAQGRLTRGRDR